MAWQTALTAALSCRFEFIELWDAATGTQRQRILEVLVAAQTCMVCVHCRGCIQYVNRRFEQITGFTLSDIHGTRLTYLMVDPASRRQTIQCIGSTDVRDHIVVMNCPTGELIINVQSRVVMWYGQRCRVALMMPILTRELEREWIDDDEPEPEPVVIGETV